MSHLFVAVLLVNFLANPFSFLLSTSRKHFDFVACFSVGHVFESVVCIVEAWIRRFERIGGESIFIVVFEWLISGTLQFFPIQPQGIKSFADSTVDTNFIDFKLVLFSSWETDRILVCKILFVIIRSRQHYLLIDVGFAQHPLDVVRDDVRNYFDDKLLFVLVVAQHWLLAKRRPALSSNTDSVFDEIDTTTGASKNIRPQS
mmetsp:Transcript_377/g.962  ORF Transcript_377/g.962 Transcript_377/m.962 type:complete len:202 (-) Transcript_377:930-1535(-)